MICSFNLGSSKVFFIAVKWEEVLTLADRLCPYTTQAMKIEVAPWIRDYVCDMEKLYTELTLEKISNEPTGEKSKSLNHYSELFLEIQDTYVETDYSDQNCNNLHGPLDFEDFDDNISSDSSVRVNWKNKGVNTDFTRDVKMQVRKGEKILFKGDPGMGKTTLLKKITWDWSNKIFKAFAIVFFVFLKLVNPRDRIENVIIEQNPYLEGLGITPEKLKAILDTFGSRCLLVLDGFDEHALGQNEDVLKIIRGQKLLDCNVIVSSRPHSTTSIEQKFPTIVRINGFTLSKAKAFASKLLSNKSKIQDVLQFNPADFRKDTPLYKCPILLSFMCLLVREDDIDLLSKTIHMGEIYTRMIRCLYKKYTIRKNIEYTAVNLVKTIINIGKLALETLLSGNPLLQRSQVIKDVGPDAFDYGLLIGHEDFRLIRDETADMFITFPHRSVQEFLGAFYFIMMLNEGQSIENLLGSDCKEPIFMMNPLFLHFCLWFLCKSQKYFTFEKKDQAWESLVDFCWNKIAAVELEITTIQRSFLAFDISGTLRKNDTLTLRFFEEILCKCAESRAVVIESFEALDWIFNVLKSLTVISTPQFNINCINKTEFVITFKHNEKSPPPELLNICQNIVKSGNVHFQIILRDNGKLDMRSFLHDSICTLHIDSYGTSNLRSSKLISCPNLTHLSFTHLNLDTSTLCALSRAVSKGRLPNVTHLTVVDCKNVAGNLALLFKQPWPKLIYFNIRGTDLNPTDLRRKVFKENLFHPKHISLALSGEQLLYMNHSLPCVPLKIFLDDVTADSAVKFSKYQSLKFLMLHNCINQSNDLNAILRKGLNHRLHKLDISHSSGITGNLSVLLHHSFPTLNSLTLSDCELNSQDLCSLAQASVEGRLPQLNHLDISENQTICVPDLFSSSCKWGQLLKLNIAGIGYKWKSSRQTEETMISCFPWLQELSINNSQILSFYSCWANVQKLCVVTSNEENLEHIADIVTNGVLPALHSICVQFSSSTRLRLFAIPAACKLSKANISVHKAVSCHNDPFTSTNCICQLDTLQKVDQQEVWV